MYETHDTHNNKMRENKKNLVQLSNPYLDGDRTKQTNQEAFNTTTTKKQQSQQSLLTNHICSGIQHLMFYHLPLLCNQEDNIGSTNP